MNPAQDAARLQELYLDLVQRAVANTIYANKEYAQISSRGFARKIAIAGLDQLGLKLVRQVDPRRREEGGDFPQTAHTMIGTRRLQNLRECVTKVLKEGIEGDLIETGVWRGGASIFMRAVLAAHGETNRRVWVCDSFAGLPPPGNAIDAADKAGGMHQEDGLAVSLEQVKENFAAYGLLDEQVVFLKGWFRDTLPTIPKDQRFAVVRLDGDLYESTMDGLANLYDKLSPGGYLIVDDFHIPACKRAVTEFRESKGVNDPIETIDWTGVYWRKRI